MSLHSMPFTAVPEETTRVARAVFPQGNLYMRMRDEIGVIYEDGAFASLLSEFRTRLITGSAEQLLLDTFLGMCRDRKFLKARGRQRTDSTHVLAAIRVLNRLECVGETLRYALNRPCQLIRADVTTAARERRSHRLYSSGS